MTTDIQPLKDELRVIRERIDALTREIRRLELTERDGTPPFAKLKGAWKGADFTEEEIDAAKIRARDLPS